MKIAFAGNPNVGKTALINAIAGSRLKVGNWPGVTVEKKEAEFEYDGKKVTLTDLPGVYTLSPYSIEERITRDFILEGSPDCIVNVVDSTNLERNLYLTLLLLEMERPVVIVLNMFDEFKKKGYKIYVDKMSQLIGTKVVPTSATKKEGIDELLKMSFRCSKHNNKQLSYQLRFESVIEREIEDVIEKLKKETLSRDYPLRFLAIKLIEKDEYAIKKIKETTGKDLSSLAEANIIRLEKRFSDDAESILTEARYGIINGILKQTFKKPHKINITLTERLDKVVINRIVGLPIFLAFMYIIFKLTFDGSSPFINWTNDFIDTYIAKYISLALSGVPQWLNSLIVNGILGGVGLVVSFVPLMFFLYFFLALLEESGYMARVAFVMDRIMNSMGLNGKAFIPMILGFGCNVPAIYATRALERESDRKLTAVMIPFMSCGARLPIYALFTAVFFVEYQAMVVLSLYMFGIAIAIIVGLILKRVKQFQSDKTPLLIELPPYRLPTLKMLWVSTWIRTRSFLVKAGTVIALTMVLLWGVIHLPPGAPIENSFLGESSRVIAPLFKLNGFDNWKIVASILPGVIAKETVVGALAQTLNVENSKNIQVKANFIKDTEDQIKGLFGAVIDSIKSMFSGFTIQTFKLESISNNFKKKIRPMLTPLSAYSFMVFMLLFIPCIVTLAAIKQEFGWRLMFFEVGLLSLVPYVMSISVYQIGILLGFG